MSRSAQQLVLRKILLRLKDEADAGDTEALILWRQAAVLCDAVGIPHPAEPDPGVVVNVNVSTPMSVTEIADGIRQSLLRNT